MKCKIFTVDSIGSKEVTIILDLTSLNNATSKHFLSQREDKRGRTVLCGIYSMFMTDKKISPQRCVKCISSSRC